MVFKHYYLSMMLCFVGVTILIIELKQLHSREDMEYWQTQKYITLPRKIIDSKKIK